MSSLNLRLFVLMALEIAIWGAWQIKIFPYMGMLGFSAAQQAWVGSVFGISSVAGIFFSNQFADRNFAAERFLAFSHLAGGVALLGAASFTDFTRFFACFLVYGLLYVPTLSVAHSLAFAHLRDPARDFGFVRMGGTIGWIVVSWPFIFLLGDRADASQTRWIFIVAAILSFALSLYSLSLPHTPPRRDVSGADRLAWVRAGRMLAKPFVLVLFVVTLIDAIIHNGYFVLIDGFLSHVGISARMTMVVSSLGQAAEIIAMLCLGTVLRRLGWKWTLLLGVGGHLVRYLVFAVFGQPEYQWLIISVQVLHGICYAFFFATVYIFVDAVFPPDARASAQGAANLLILGLGMVAASQLFPRLLVQYSSAGAVDYARLFLVPVSMAAVAIALLAVGFNPPKRAPEGAA
jgi:hypothetical protein